MKRTAVAVNITVLAICAIVVVSCSIAVMKGALALEVMQWIIGITIVLALAALYVTNYAFSSYGGKFKTRSPDAK